MFIFTAKQKFDALVFQQTTEACDQIMNEMGAEIHDDLIQKLSIFQLYMDRLEGAVPDNPEVNDLLLKMRCDFEIVSQSVRRISRRMMPVRMENDSFNTTLSLLCQNMEQIKSGTIHFENIGTEQALPAFHQAHLYRIVQELIHNAFKHSSAWHIWVRLHWDVNRVVVEVEDDGTGVNQIHKFMSRLRMKNNTLRMRCKLLGAKISYLYGQKGLLAKIELPLKRAL